MKVSNRCVALVKGFEGGQSADGMFRPYYDRNGNVWTIGYGHTGGVTAHSRPLTEAEASALLRRDLDQGYAPSVNRTNSALSLELTQSEFDALVCAVYNIGPGIMEAGRTMGDALRSKDRRRIGDAFLVYSKDANGQTLAGLIRRRRLERKLFLSESRPTMAAWLTPVELRRVIELDAIRRGARKPEHPGREEVLVRELSKQRRAIWRAAQPMSAGGDGHGWRYANRRRRYITLETRTA
jgi:lysozyme